MRLFSILSFTFFYWSISAQSPSNLSSICATSDYKFLIGSEFYDADKTGFICNGNLPAIITLYSKATNLPVTATDIKWLGAIDSSYGMPNQAIIRDSHFVNDIVKFTVTFTENGKKEEIKDYKISKDLKVIASKSLNPSDIFDDVRDGSGNYIKEYWPSHTPSKEKPWIFGGNNATLSVKNKKGKKAGKDGFKSVSVGTTGNGSFISPSNFAGDDSNFNIGQSMPTSGSYPFINSCSTDTVAYIYSQGMKSYFIDFFLLCETDDDLQAALGPVPSHNTVCINPGPDGYIDEILRRGGPRYKSPLDTIITIGGKRYIVAGKDSICQTIVNPNKPPKCSKSKDLSLMMSELNQLYNPIGVSFTLYSYDTLYFNYNTYNEDDSLSKDEQSFMYAALLGSTPTNTTVLIVDNITKSTSNEVLGRATSLSPPVNHLSISKKSDGFVLAHEIGHAKFGFRHPDDDKDHLIETGSPAGPFKVIDLKNFMHSEANSISNSMIRHYQWKKIHTGKYNN